MYLYTHTYIHTYIHTAYPSAVKKLPLVKPDHGFHLKALVDIDADEGGVARKAGDEWLLKGPATYIPRPEVVRERENPAYYNRNCFYISVVMYIYMHSIIYTFLRDNSQNLSNYQNRPRITLVLYICM